MNRIGTENKGIFRFLFVPKIFFISDSYITDFIFKSEGILNTTWKLTKGTLEIQVDYNQTL